MYTFSELIAYARRMARNASGTLADTQIKQAVNDAVFQIATSKEWDRYKTQGQLSVNGVVSSGNLYVTKDSTTVTLSGATFPSWSSGAQIRIETKTYPIASGSASGTVTLDFAPRSDTATYAAGEWELFQDEYELPEDLFKFGRLLPGENWSWGGEPVGVEQLLEALSGFPTSFRYPSMWCLWSRKAINTLRIKLYPYPNTDVAVQYWYYRKPETMDDTTDYCDIAPAHIELLHRAIDYQISLYFEGAVPGGPTECYKRYIETFMRCSQNDQMSTHPSRPTMRNRGGLARFRLGT